MCFNRNQCALVGSCANWAILAVENEISGRMLSKMYLREPIVDLYKPRSSGWRDG